MDHLGLHSLSGGLGKSTFHELFFFQIDFYTFLLQTFTCVVIRKINTQACHRIVKHLSGHLQTRSCLSVINVNALKRISEFCGMLISYADTKR